MEKKMFYDIYLRTTWCLYYETFLFPSITKSKNKLECLPLAGHLRLVFHLWARSEPTRSCPRTHTLAYLLTKKKVLAFFPQDNLNFNFVDEFDDVVDDFGRTPRRDDSPESTPRSEAGSVTVLECKQLLRPSDSRCPTSTSKRPLTGNCEN